MNEYQWKKGARISGLAAEVVAKHLESLEINGNGISPESVVESARPSGSPIHKAFTWNNAEAANQYRLWQARHLIGSLEVRMEGPLSEEPISVRAYLNASVEDSEQVYYSLGTIKDIPELKAQVLEQVRRDIAAARNKLAGLESVFAELMPLALALDSARELAETIA